MMGEICAGGGDVWVPVCVVPELLCVNYISLKYTSLCCSEYVIIFFVYLFTNMM